MNFSVEFQQYHTYIHYHSPIRLNRWLQRITDSHIIVCIVIDIVCPSITHVEIRMVVVHDVCHWTTTTTKSNE